MGSWGGPAEVGPTALDCVLESDTAGRKRGADHHEGEAVPSGEGDHEYATDERNPPADSIALELGDTSTAQSPASSEVKPISLEGGRQDAAEFTSNKIRTFESQSGLKGPAQHEFKRPLNTDGRGATRVRTFHTKLNDAAFRFLDEQINDWIDANPGVEVKFTNTTIGTVEGKRPEPQVIISIWY